MKRDIAKKQNKDKMTASEKKVYSLLHHGRLNAIPLETLAQLANLNKRTVIHVIYALRTKFGFQIGSALSKPNGYFIMTNETEYQQVRKTFIEKLKSASISYHSLARAHKLSKGKFEDKPYLANDVIQLSLFEGGEKNEIGFGRKSATRNSKPHYRGGKKSSVQR